MLGRKPQNTRAPITLINLGTSQRANSNGSIVIVTKKTSTITIKRGPDTWTRPEETELVALVCKGISIEALAKSTSVLPRQLG